MRPAEAQCLVQPGRVVAGTTRRHGLQFIVVNSSTTGMTTAFALCRFEGNGVVCVRSECRSPRSAFIRGRRQRQRRGRQQWGAATLARTHHIVAASAASGAAAVALTASAATAALWRDLGGAPTHPSTERNVTWVHSDYRGRYHGHIVEGGID